MVIVGEWHLDDDQVLRPTLRAKVYGAGTDPVAARFLVDGGADRTILSAALLTELSLPITPAPAELAVSGIGGQSGFVLLATRIELTRDDGGPVSVRGEFAALPDPKGTDLNILGRDVLNNFDVIISWKRREILLLAGNHQYHVTQT